MRNQRPNPRTAAGALALLAFVHVPAARVQAAGPSEYELKAVLIYKVASYIRWPAAGEASARRPFVIGILGRDPFGRVIDEVVAGETVHGRPVSIRRLSEAREASQCDLLYVSPSERSGFRRILHRLEGTPVLTVGDMDQFATAGGMINLTNDDRRIRFEINVSALDRAGLRAAAELLTLARIVDRPVAKQ